MRCVKLLVQLIIGALLILGILHLRNNPEILDQFKAGALNSTASDAVRELREVHKDDFVLFTTPGDADSARFRDYLNSEGIPYVEFDVTINPTAESWLRRVDPRLRTPTLLYQSRVMRKVDRNFLAPFSTQ